MNNKVSRFQVGMFLFLISSSLYLGISDIVLLRKANDEVLISMLLGTILGLIPVLMYLKINSSITDLNIFEKNKKLFGKVIGFIINICLIVMYMLFLAMATRAVVMFVTSKYLQATPYYLVGILVIVTGLIISFKGIETILRVSRLSFFCNHLFFKVKDKSHILRIN